MRNDICEKSLCIHALTLSQTSPFFMCLQYKFFENALRKGEIARNKQFLLFIRPSKTGRIMGSPVAGGRRPVLCPEHISKTTLARVMKFHGWIDLIQGECSAQES